MLGEIRLRADGTELDAVQRQPKRLAVLAYLSAPAPGTRHRRDLLLALFWPDLDTGHARTSLRNAIYVLRQSLGDQVLHSTGDEEISVNPDLLKTDLAVVLAALKEGRIDDALAAYGGELLPGLFPADSEGFLRWLDSERTRLKVAVSSAAAGRLNELERRKEFPQALAIARRMLEIQPDDETIVRRAMTLHEAMGDMAGGLNVFEKYRSRLAADFDASPSQETSALADRLRSSPRPAATRSKSSAVRDTRVTEDAATPDAIVQTLSQTPDSPRRWLIPLIVAAVLTVAAIGGWIWTRSARPLSIGAVSPLTSDEGLQVEAAISSDGEFVAYAKGNTAHLRIFVRQIDGGREWPLTVDSISHQIVPRWSPKKNELLFLSRNNAYVTPFIGGEPRLVARGESGERMVRSASWSPGGDSIAIVRNDSLFVQPLDGPPTRYLGTGYQLHSCVWSPHDGKWIACTSGNWIEFESGPIFGNPGESSIVLFPAAGGKSIQLTDTTYQNRTPAWSADGKFLWFLSDRDGVKGETYAMPIASDGHVADSVVRQGVTAEWISMTASRITYSESERRANVWRIAIPRGAPVDINAAEKVTSGTSLIETVSISHDGKWLFYDSNENGNPDIYRKQLPQGLPQRITRDDRLEYAADLSPDGTELAWQRWNKKGQRRIVVRKLDGNEAPVDIVPTDIIDRGGPRWSRDGKSIAGWTHTKTEGTLFVVKRDAAGKWQKVSWGIHNAQLPQWSPDSRTIAFVTNDGNIGSVPADSGARKIFYSPRPGTDDPTADNLAWTSSPDTVWFLAHIKKSGEGSIWSLALSSGTRKLLARLKDPKRLTGLTLATDQKYFYFTLDERFSNIRWAELVKR